MEKLSKMAILSTPPVFGAPVDVEDKSIGISPGIFAREKCRVHRIYPWMYVIGLSLFSN